jgi:hypothetical protein
MKKTLSIVIVCALVALSVALISGCSQPAGTSPTDDGNSLNQGRFQQGVRPQDRGGGQNPSGYPGRLNGTMNGSGRFGNMTEAERQALMEERLQQGKEACAGKAEGDTCTTPSPRGDQEGTCTLQDANLICRGQMGGQREPRQ